MSYVEADGIHYAFKIMATFKNVSISSLMREATEQYLTREDPSGVFVQQAKKALNIQSDTAKERSKDALDPRVIELAKALHKKLSK